MCHLFMNKIEKCVCYYYMVIQLYLNMNKIDDIYKNIFASSLTISTAVGIFNPLDCLRIRWQMLKFTNTKELVSFDQSLFQYTNGIIKKEGFINGLYKPGLFPNMIGAAISRGIGMGVYPLFRDNILQILGNNYLGSSMFLGGLVSGAIGYTISSPFWILKARIQGGKETRLYLYKNIFDGMRTIIKTEGFASLFKGYGCLAVRGALMNAGNTFGYDGTKKIVRDWDLPKSFEKLLTNRNNEETILFHVLASVNASLASCVLSTPIDFITTSYQNSTQTNLIKLTKDIVSKDITLLYKGFVPMFIRVTQIYCLYLPCYEQVRCMIGLGYL